MIALTISVARMSFAAGARLIGAGSLALAVGLLAACSDSPDNASTWNPQPVARRAENAQVAPAQPPAARPPAAAPRTPPKPMPGDPHTPPPVTALGLPPVEVTPAIMDFGTIRPGQKMSGDFSILNISDKPLKILSTKASCTCTSVNMDNTMIDPGAAVQLHVQYSIASGTGPKTSAVRVLVEGYDLMELPIKANVTTPIMTEPGFVNALKDEEGKPVKSGDLTVISEDGKPFKISAFNRGPVPFVAFDPAKDPLQASYRLHWDFTAFDSETGLDANGKRIPACVVIETDRKDCPVIDVEIRHNALRRSMPAAADQWMIQEKRVSLGAIAPGASAQTEILAKWLPKRGETDVIKSVQSESPDFTAELTSVERAGDSMICKVKVTPAPGFKGLVYGNVRIRSANQSWPVLIVGSVVE